MWLLSDFAYVCCCGWCWMEGDSHPNKHNSNDNLESVTVEKKIAIMANKLDQIEDKPLITDNKLKNEFNSAFKGGESAYFVQKITKRSRKQTKNEEKLKKFLKTRKCDLVGFLGDGNYSEVYRIRFIPKDKDMAIKVINLKKVEEYYVKNYLPNELKILKKIPKHKNIIQTIELNQIKDNIFIFMEFASNGMVSDWLRDHGVFIEPIAKLIFKGILDAICELQRRHIAHRDLKLENILLTAQMNPKIIDFSYAIEVDPESVLSTQFCGTLPYFAPEILQKQAHNPLISDAWSLGVCFYIMVNDRLPFELGNDSLMLRKQLNKEWGFRKTIDLSLRLKKVIRSLLEPNVKLRATPFDLKKSPWFKRGN